MAMKIAKNITQLIGRTPLVELERINKLHGTHLIAKLEFFNPLSSIKDRIALSMIEEAEQKGILNKDSIIVEPTSGNTGIGLAYICAYKGYKLILTMPETMSIERQQLLKAFGTELILTSGSTGMASAIQAAEDIVKKNPNAFMPMQFKNMSNPAIHEKTTAKEIWEDTQGNVSAIIAGIGTGGTISGIGKFFKTHKPDTQIIAYEPENSAVIAGGKAGAHKIQGIGAGFIPSTFLSKYIDSTVSVSDADAYKYTRLLANQEGIFAGISSGATVSAALQLINSDELSNEPTVLIFPDSGERYVSTKGLFT